MPIEINNSVITCQDVVKNIRILSDSSLLFCLFVAIFELFLSNDSPFYYIIIVHSTVLSNMQSPHIHLACSVHHWPSLYGYTISFNIILSSIHMIEWKQAGRIQKYILLMDKIPFYYIYNVIYSDYILAVTTICTNNHLLSSSS